MNNDKKKKKIQQLADAKPWAFRKRQRSSTEASLPPRGCTDTRGSLVNPMLLSGAEEISDSHTDDYSALLLYG